MAGCFLFSDIDHGVVFSCEKQLYKRLCPSVSPSVGPSVRNALTKTAKTVRIQVNSSKFKQIQENSRLFATIGRVTALFFKMRLRVCF